MTLRRHFPKLLATACAILATVWACEETVDFDVDAAAPRLVVEGVVTDRFQTHSVRITRTAPLEAEGEGDFVEDAAVNLKLLGGAPPDDPELPSHPAPDFADVDFFYDRDGYYRSEIPFRGLVGRAYRLTVTVDGRTLVAEDSMHFAYGFIDYYCFRAAREVDSDIEQFRDEQLYEQIAVIPDDPATDNYYLLKFYTVTDDRDEIVENSRGVDVHIASDRLTGDTLTIFPQHYTFYGDSVRMESFSLSRPVYTYYQDLKLLLENNGDLLTGTPANPLNNFYYKAEDGSLRKAEDVLGVFQTSMLHEDSLVVGAPESGCCEPDKPVFGVDTVDWQDCDCLPGCLP